MIIPMNKYSFLVYHREYEGFLHDLQKLGVVHVIEKTTGELEDPAMRDKHLKIQQLTGALNFLQKRMIEPAGEQVKTDGLKTLDEILRLQSDKEHYIQKSASLKKDIALVEPWGDFSWDTIEKLKQAGVRTRFFSCSPKAFKEEWMESFCLEKILDSKDQTNFVIFERAGETIEINAEEVLLPQRKLTFLKEQIEDNEALLSKTEDLFDQYASQHIESLQTARAKLAGEFSFDKVILNTLKEAEDRLMILEGWVPKDSEDNLVAYLKNQSIYYVSEKPKSEDNVPVKLKNNWFAKLFEPIGSLYSLPSYKEFDLTALYAPFYALFFGFCLGDAGYGLLILTVATVLKFVPKFAGMRGYLNLAQWLGLSTIIMGFISGTFFGINLLQIEGFSMKKYMLDSNKMFYLSMIIGLIQIIFGMCIKAYSLIVLKGFKYALSTIGWITLILSLIGIFGFGSELSPGLKKILLYSVLGACGILIFVFSDPDSNPLISSLKGLWDAYGMISGVFGDTLSYIRLFALGTSGAILGFVMNTIALQMLHISYVGPVFFVIFLLFGHGLTIALSALGAFVHPMRLTFVEFYKNAGFIGGGKPYRPFRLETK
jgi:V/A-type H+/Na+-transporting ATPase subunit I